jgi:hypothetical protein
MQGCRDRSLKLCAYKFAVMPGKAEMLSNQSLRRACTQTYNDFGLDQRYLLLKPGATGLDFVGPRLQVQA